jgi:hypothetical protein
MPALTQVLETLITDSLPDLFTGEERVGLTVETGLVEIDPQSAEAAASEPRPDDRLDEFPFDPADPAGPYTLTQPPYPGPRRARLTTDANDRITLREDEIIWDEMDDRIFTLALRPNRELDGLTRVQVLYGVTAVYTKLKALQTVTLLLASEEADRLAEAEVMALAVIALNRPYIVDQAQVMIESGDYGAQIVVNNLILVNTTAAAENRRLITLRAQIELKASRALGEAEGRPITHIRSPGRPPDPDRAVDIHIEVDA